MSIRRTLLLSSVVLVLPAMVVHAQDTTKKALATGGEKPRQQLSPRDTSRATVGDAKVMIDYGRPSKRNRAIFGELVPFDKVWRTGANGATTLVTDKPLVVGGTELPAGSYTLYTVPGKTEWKLIINKQTGQWGTEYKEEMDLARIPMTVAALSAPVEKFEIAVERDTLHLRWDMTDATVPISAKQ